MRRIRVRVRATTYRRGGKLIHRKGYTYLRRDVGKPGKTPKSKQWFNPKSTLGGWSKSQKASTRRRLALASTPKNWSLRRRVLQAARKLQALANVTADKATKQKAQADADYFWKRLKNLPRK
jgi:hypothetical protein